MFLRTMRNPLLFAVLSVFENCFTKVEVLSNHNTQYQLLVAAMTSSQSSDKVRSGSVFINYLRLEALI